MKWHRSVKEKPEITVAIQNIKRTNNKNVVLIGHCNTFYTKVTRKTNCSRNDIEYVSRYKDKFTNTRNAAKILVKKIFFIVKPNSRL